MHCTVGPKGLQLECQFRLSVAVRRGVASVGCRRFCYSVAAFSGRRRRQEACFLKARSVAYCCDLLLPGRTTVGWLGLAQLSAGLAVVAWATGWTPSPRSGAHDRDTKHRRHSIAYICILDLVLARVSVVATRFASRSDGAVSGSHPPDRPLKRGRSFSGQSPSRLSGASLGLRNGHLGARQLQVEPSDCHARCPPLG